MLPQQYRYATENGPAWQALDENVAHCELISVDKDVATYRVTILGVDLGEKELVPH